MEKGKLNLKTVISITRIIGLPTVRQLFSHKIAFEHHTECNPKTNNHRHTFVRIIKDRGPRDMKKTKALPYR